MQIIDLTENYRISLIQNHNREAYEDSFPELFEHYYKFWTSKEFSIIDVPGQEINIRKEWIKGHIENLFPIFDKNNIDHDLFDIVFFIGVGTTNGHAFRLNDRFHVWLPLEAYPSEQLVKVFVTHEIAHALHYHNSPSFYFENEKEKITLSRLLITEGLATYLTRELLGISDLEALWADFLDKTAAVNWWESCRREEPRLYKILNDDYSGNETNSELFQANDKGDIFRFRAGYYAGLTLIERYVKNQDLTIPELLETRRGKLEMDIYFLIRKRLYKPGADGHSVE